MMLKSLALFISLLSLARLDAAPSPSGDTRPFGLVIHGGAGSTSRDKVGPEVEKRNRDKLQEVLDAGYAVLARGGSAEEAVIVAVNLLEDSGLFNCGRGAVANDEGLCELDASVMNGSTLKAGSVAGVQRIANPVSLARAVMEKTKHVMLIADGAEKFAQQEGFPFVNQSYFLNSREHPQAFLSPEADLLRHSIIAHEYGTVGCVAVDRQSNVAAATSTGGTAKKKYGRVGDSPIIGAGTYANNATCAVSCTGNGEAFIRTVVGYDISAQIEYRDVPLPVAVQRTLAKVGQLGQTGGIIALNARGEATFAFNSPGMTRGLKFSDGRNRVLLFDEQ